MHPPTWFWAMIILIFCTSFASFILLGTNKEVHCPNYSNFFPGVIEKVDCSKNCSEKIVYVNNCTENTEKVNSSNNCSAMLEKRRISYDTDYAIPPHYLQVFPIEDFPGLKCYVIASSMRHLVISENCQMIYIQSENITIGQYVIPRQAPGKRCNRCYFSDYLNSLSLILFGKPELGIEPLAPRGAVIMEDDVIICRKAMETLKKCYDGQFNCILGNGAWINYYASPFTTQPNPENYSKYRFTTSDEIFTQNIIGKELHLDMYIIKYKKHAIQTDFANHVGASYSVMNHKPGYWPKCLMNETIASKVVVGRTKDIKIWVAEKNDAND